MHLGDQLAKPAGLLLQLGRSVVIEKREKTVLQVRVRYAVQLAELLTTTYTMRQKRTQEALSSPMPVASTNPSPGNAASTSITRATSNATSQPEEG